MSDDAPRDVRDIRLVYKVIAAAAGIIVVVIAAAWVIAGVIVPWSQDLNTNDLTHTFRLDAQKDRIDGQDRRFDGQDKRMDGIERSLRFHERGHAPTGRESPPTFPGVERPRGRPQT